MNTLRSILTTCGITLLGLVALPLSAVTITGDFSDYTAPSSEGPALTTAAGFAPPGGNSTGWLNGWRSAGHSGGAGATVTAQVLDTSPINSGGNYLSGVFTANSVASGTKDGFSLTRAYDVAGNSLASATALYVNYDLRVDSINVSTMNINLFDANVRSTTGSSTVSSWQIVVQNGVWRAYNGGTLTTLSGLSFNAGVTYSVAIVANPTTFKWDFTISDGLSSVSGTNFGFRANNFSTDSTTGDGRWIGFGAVESTDIASQSATFSLDNIYIGTTAAIPEPSSYALLFGAASLGLMLIGKRRRRCS
ncbi:MAG: PEP-CTERM sorting domain-containing protein [Opitutaceae bacterium]|jgi:hypothetical protein